MKVALQLITIYTGLTTAALAAPQVFDFKDPKGVNNAVFKLDAPLEAISGSANGISGKITFDPANPAATQGKIIVASSSLHVGNPTMNEHLHSAKWLDVAKHPEIAFESKQFKNVKTTGDTISAEVTGTLTLKGTSREITTPIKFTYLKDKLAQRFPKFQGDLLVLRANFNIKRSEFGINPGQNEDKVSDDIELSLSIAGASVRNPL